MIVIAGRVAVRPDNVEAALPLAQEMMAETLKEPGCAAYNFSADLDEAGVFHLFEEWKSQEALDSHLASPHSTVRHVNGCIHSVGARYQ